MNGGPADGLARMRAWVDGLPGQIQGALAAAEERGWPPSGPPPVSVWLGGMGGSGMAGLMAASILQDRLAVPIGVRLDPEVPAWVGPGSLAIVSSYSGETWEAREMLRTCLARGARTVAIASGGALAAEATAAGAPCFRLPPGYAPRAALGWLLVPAVLAAAQAAPGLTAEAKAELAGAASLLEEEIALWRTGRARPGRDPSALAAELRERFTIACAPSERLYPAALRWKNQILENAKQPAAALHFPEAVHNEVEGWGRLAPAAPASLLFLEEEPAAAGARGTGLVAARGEADRSGVRCARAAGSGRTPAAKMLAHVLLADRTSVEIAGLLGIDPVPVEAIGRVKAALAKAAGTGARADARADAGADAAGDGAGRSGGPARGKENAP